MQKIITRLVFTLHKHDPPQASEMERESERNETIKDLVNSFLFIHSFIHLTQGLEFFILFEGIL
jgi:hypothetical protein